MSGRNGCEGSTEQFVELLIQLVRKNCTFVREKSGNFRNLWLWQPWLWCYYLSLFYYQSTEKRYSKCFISRRSRYMLSQFQNLKFWCPFILWLKVWLVYSRIQAEMVLIPSPLHVDGHGHSYLPFEVNRYPICFFTFQSKNCTGSFFVLVLMSCRHSHFMPVMTNLETGETKQPRLGYSLCTCM